MWRTLYSAWLIMFFLIFWPYIKFFIRKECYNFLHITFHVKNVLSLVLIIRILYKNFPFKTSVSLHVRKHRFFASCIPWSMHISTGSKSFGRHPLRGNRCLWSLGLLTSLTHAGAIPPPWGYVSWMQLIRELSRK